MPPSAVMKRSARAEFVEHKPLDAPMTLEQRTRSFLAKIDDVNPKERAIVAKINTDSIDRYKTVIMPRGALLDAYRRNPVVLWEHGEDPARGSMPIGRNDWITSNDREIKARTIFRDDAYSRELFDCYKEGWLSAWSVRMVNPEYSAPTPAEIGKRPELKDCRLIFRKWELGEYSGTTVPGNSETLTILEKRGIFISPRVRAMTDSIGGMAGGGATVEPQNGLKRYVKKIGDKWHVMSEEGKSLGEYDSEDAAKERLQQIEYFKHKDKGDRSAPYIVEEGGLWWIDEGFRRKLSFPTAKLAEECLRLMTQGGAKHTAEVLMSVSLGDVRKAKAEIVEDIMSYVQLYTRGKI